MSQTIAFLPPRADVLSQRARIIADLADLLPEGGLVHEARELVPFETDAYVAYRQLPLAVALPRTTQEVSAVLEYCNRHGIPVVPRGAGTSLCGGAFRSRMLLCSASRACPLSWTSISRTGSRGCRPA